MDLLRTMMANRAAAGASLVDPAPRPEPGKKKEPKSKRAKRFEAGTKDMRRFIIEEKPSKTVVRDHFVSIVEQECVSEEDE
jgi:hypothetical protein